MANLKLKNPSGGSLALVSADGASDLTVTFPAVTGTAMVSGNMPAFSVYSTSTLSVSNATDTKVTYNTEDFDTANCFASNRFTPNVAGYYEINAGLFCAGAAGGGNVLSLYKNGGIYFYLARTLLSGSFNVMSVGGCLVYCNGTTDYLEIYTYQNSGGTLSMGNSDKTGCWFTGSLVRGA